MPQKIVALAIGVSPSDQGIFAPVEVKSTPRRARIVAAEHQPRSDCVKGQG
jgi:hypothetical protein